MDTKQMTKLDNYRRGPRPHACGPRPHVWVTGPDPEEHKRYRAFIQQKNQAQFREEGWDIPFEAWLEMWGDLWPLRGRTRDSYCMTRYDPFGPWDRENTMVIERREHSRRTRRERANYTSLKLERQSKK